MIGCWSGDAVARRTAAYYRDADWTDVAKRDINFRECGAKAWKHEFGDIHTPMAQQRTRRKILVGFPGDCVLLEVELSSNPLVEQIKDRAITGSDRTTVKHLVNNYFPRSPQP